jgi:ABC-type transport system involved in cytochrome bd biosynthesis fused ATPase/permease subunit
MEGPGFFGIIGESGSGKSLLADCLAGFKLPDQGEILFNQKKIQHVHDLYLVSSLTPIYPLSLIDNIKLQSPYDAEKFEKILETCDLTELKHSVGLKVLNPDQLSLGEKQRIIMARAMYYSPSCIILDESLSSLDFLREKKMLKFLKDHSLNNLVIHISHQLDSVRDAKTIFLLENGHLLKGTWSQLAQDPNSLISRYEQRHT